MRDRACLQTRPAPIVVLMDHPVLHGPSYCESSCCQALVMTTSPATGAASPETEGIVRKDW